MSLSLTSTPGVNPDVILNFLKLLPSLVSVVDLYFLCNLNTYIIVMVSSDISITIIKVVIV